MHIKLETVRERHKASGLNSYADLYEVLQAANFNCGIEAGETGTIPAQAVDFACINEDSGSIWQDLGECYFRVREGGYIAGHKYGHKDSPLVKNTVDRFFERFSWHVNSKPSGLWWVEKRTLPISYFIPAYNCERWVSESIKSIIDSNYKPHEGDELILVDDASTDGTKHLLQQFASFERVRLIEHEENRGGGAARNTAVGNAENQLCFCLDSDNVLEADSVSLLRDHLIINDVETVGFQEMRYFTSEGGKTKPTHIWCFDDRVMDLAAFLQTNRAPSSSGNYLFTQNAWSKADGYPDAGALDTWGFLLRKLAAGSNIKVLPNSHYNHRYSHESYWVRHSQQGNLNEVAADLMEPYLERLIAADVRYLKSDKGRKTWFSRLGRRPLRTLHGKNTGFAWIPKFTTRKSRMRCTERHLKPQLVPATSRAA